jgi:hypothetical protein
MDDRFPFKSPWSGTLLWAPLLFPWLLVRSSSWFIDNKRWLVGPKELEDDEQD